MNSTISGSLSKMLLSSTKNSVESAISFLECSHVQGDGQSVRLLEGSQQAAADQERQTLRKTQEAVRK